MRKYHVTRANISLEEEAATCIFCYNLQCQIVYRLSKEQLRNHNRLARKKKPLRPRRPCLAVVKHLNNYLFILKVYSVRT